MEMDSSSLSDMSALLVWRRFGSCTAKDGILEEVFNALGSIRERMEITSAELEARTGSASSALLRERRVAFVMAIMCGWKPGGMGGRV